MAYSEYIFDEIKTQIAFNQLFLQKKLINIIAQVSK